MVRGLSKRVIVLKMDDEALFEEAIFIVRSDAQKGRNAEDVLREAKRVALEYARREKKAEKWKLKIPAPFFAAAGAAATAIAWLAMRLIGV